MFEETDPPDGLAMTNCICFSPEAVMVTERLPEPLVSVTGVELTPWPSIFRFTVHGAAVEHSATLYV